MPASGKIYHGHKTRNGITKVYRTWLGMKRRCYDKKCKDYKNWGGRGIQVCDEWRYSFTSFLSDMGEPPSKNHTLDRLDSSSDYCRDNCRWATQQQQGSENRRGLKPITVGGKDFPSIKKAAEYFGVKITTLHYRINAGFSFEKISDPNRAKSRRNRESYLPKNHPDRIKTVNL